MTMMLTADAAEAIKSLSDVPGAEGLRISSSEESVDSQGPALQVELAAAPEPSDSVVEAAGTRIFLAPEAAQTMDDKVLDAEVESGEVRFGLLNQEGEEG